MKYFLYRFFAITLKILAGCLLGCIIILFCASRSDLVHYEIKKSVKTIFKQNFNCDWDGQVESIDLLSWQIQFSNILLTPCNEQEGWVMFADTFQMTGFWPDFFLYRKFSCHGYFDHVVVHEKQSGSGSYFAQILSKMISGALPAIFSFDYVTIKDGQVILQDASMALSCDYSYDCQMSRELDGLHTKLYLLDGNVSYKNNIVLEKMYGNFISIVPYNFDLQEIYAKIDCRLSVPLWQDQGNCFLLGDVYGARGSCVISNDDQSFIIQPCKFRLKPDAIPVTCSMNITTDLMQLLLCNQIFVPDLAGMLNLTLTTNVLDVSSGIQGSVEIQDLSYKNNQIFDKGSMAFVSKDEGYQLTFLKDQEQILQGSLFFKQDAWSFAISNNSTIPLSWSKYWQLLVNNGKIFGTVDRFYNLFAHYDVQADNSKTLEQVNVQGDFIWDGKSIKAAGAFLDKKYDLVVDVYPKINLVSFLYANKDEDLINFHAQKNCPEEIQGFVGFNCIKNLVSDSYKSSFSQPGKFEMQGMFVHGEYLAKVMTENAHIRIPLLYSVIQDFTAKTNIDFMGRSIGLDDMMAQLYEGTISCQHAIAKFDAQGKLSFVHAPLFLNNVFIGWQKGIFGMLSGKIFIYKQLEKIPMLQGNLIVDQVQLKGNIFSTEFQELFLNSAMPNVMMDTDCMLDIKIQTKEPVLIETSFLKATAHLEVSVSNSLQQPEIEGCIDLVSGELKFPYKSLYLTQGQILITPKSLTEPSIEFVAKGKIKRYNITMRASGTMMDRQIKFESSPYLTEDQILSLLLLGSPDSSLNIVMPAIIMQKVQDIVFGPALSQSTLDVMFHRLLQSFKNIRIFPQFTNQTGRGGVRGVVEVDATDRLHGRIDVNVLQPEDTIFEADYALTDDITIKAIKDSPSTYGGEVEMRWKFS